MVFFTCNACGESLKKGQVEKHSAQCRNSQGLSCIDCGKDFWGDDYKNHLKCMSEDQKYGGKAFEAKANKGDVKQQQWIQRIHEAMNKPNITPKIKSILNQISTFDNIPRKKAKFQNLMKNSLKIRNQPIQDQVWEIFSEATSTTKEASAKDTQDPAGTATPEETSQPSETTGEIKKKSKRERKEERQKQNKKEKKEESMENGTKKKGKKRRMEDESQENDDEDKTTEKKKKKHENDEEDVQGSCEQEPRAQKKRKHVESQEQEGHAENSAEEENDEENSANKGKFNWKGTIKALLRQAPDNELPIKKLRKKVIAQYYTVSSAQHKSEEELLAAFNKKINSNPKFRVLKERVKLIK